MGITKAYKELADQELPGLAKLLESIIDFDSFGFTKSYCGVAKEFMPSIIYNSDKCRVRFSQLPADLRDGPDSATLHILYGRLHASIHSKYRMWRKRKCHCWHNLLLDRIFQFLDGLSPQEAVNNKYELPIFLSQFNQVNIDSGWSNIEWAVRQTSLIWDYYGNRLFDLFDLSRPDLWERYSIFIKDFYRLCPSILNPSAPPREDIC